MAGKLTRLATAVGTYGHVRRFARRFSTRNALERWQRSKIERWLKNDVRAVSAFKNVSPAARSLDDFPLMDKATLMANFDAFNRAGVTAQMGWQAFEGAKKIGAYTVGASTGTSGNRGLFVISPQERFAWLGAILAKAAPDFWRHRDRVAVLLPINTPLYDTANQSSLMALKFFDIGAPIDSHVQALEAFAPSIIIAPPRVLRMLAQRDLRLDPRLVFSAAEKLDEIDRAIIEAKFNQPLKQIYMATEGLLAVSCAHNRLHLAEDCMHFELRDVGGGLVSPIISDFSRRTQIMVRYQLNDLLRMDDTPCPCGSPLRVVHEVVGRMDDVFILPAGNGQSIDITPDILRNAIVDADRSIDDFRLIQQADDTLHLMLPAHLSDDTFEKARAGLMAVLRRHGARDTCAIARAPWCENNTEKLRRVKRAIEKQP